MTFSDALTSFFKNYFVFSGRASRAEFWKVMLVVWPISLILPHIVPELILPIGLGLVIPSLALSARRLHDTDRSGLWLFLSLVPVVGLYLIVFYVEKGTQGRNRFDAPATPDFDPAQL